MPRLRFTLPAITAAVMAVGAPAASAATPRKGARLAPTPQNAVAVRHATLCLPNRPGPRPRAARQDRRPRPPRDAVPAHPPARPPRAAPAPGPPPARRRGHEVRPPDGPRGLLRPRLAGRLHDGPAHRAHDLPARRARL